MSAIEKGQENQQASGAESSGASPSLDELVPMRGLRKASGDANLVPRSKRSEAAEMSDQKSNQSNVVRWLQLFAAVGIPLLLAYLALVSLVNPQFAEIREIVSDNRDAIAANRSSIERLDAKIDSSIASLDAKIDSSVASLDAKIGSSVASLDAKIDSSVARLEARIDLVIEVLILAFTNDNLTEEELRNLLDAGES